MSRVTYCTNGCTTNRNNERTRTQTEPPSLICGRCETNLHQWLTDIPTNFALLPTFIEHGTIERNPESKTTKASVTAAPMRLEIIDLLDIRRGLKWNGTTPAHDRRGIAGTLQVHVDRLIEERPLTIPHDDSDIAAACALLDRHRLWLAEQDWITYLYDDIKQTNRELSDAIGDYRRPPVGHCHVVTADDDTPCDGPLYASDYAGVHCARCGATWDADQLRMLGLAQQAQQQEAS